MVLYFIAELPLKNNFYWERQPPAALAPRFIGVVSGVRYLYFCVDWSIQAEQVIGESKSEEIRRGRCWPGAVFDIKTVCCPHFVRTRGEDWGGLGHRQTC